MLDDVERRYPARHYVMVDDKLRILASMKAAWGPRLTTVFVAPGALRARSEDPRGVSGGRHRHRQHRRVGPGRPGAGARRGIGTPTVRVSPTAGSLADPATLVDVPALVTAYYSGVPDPAVPSQRVAFGTSGHRGSSLDTAFNEGHILAIAQAVCLYRAQHRIDGPLFLGMDTHALSVPAHATALEVMAANGVELMIADHDGYAPTPAVSHAIVGLQPGAGERAGRRHRDHAVSQPPSRRRLQIQPASWRAGGTRGQWVDRVEGERIARGRTPRREAGRLGESASGLHDPPARLRHGLHERSLCRLDMDAIRGAGVTIGVDPLGGAGVHYWGPIADRYGLALTVVDDEIDPTFRFMTVDWDGQIRMDPSSPYAMRRLIGLKDRSSIAFACDTDHDRHGSSRAARACCRRITTWRPPSRTSSRTGRRGARRGGGEDGREQPDDRPRCRPAGPAIVRGAGRLQVVRRRPARRVARFRGRGERRRLVRPARRHCLDDGQGRHRRGVARRGDHRAGGP